MPQAITFSCLYLAFGNTDRGVENRPDDVLVTAGSSQRAVVSVEASGSVGNKIHQRKGIRQDTLFIHVGVNNFVKIFQMAEGNVISSLQLRK
jgi:hypothetical protein